MRRRDNNDVKTAALFLRGQGGGEGGRVNEKEMARTY